MFRTRLCKMVESDNVPNPYQKVRYGKPSPLIAALEQVPKSRAIAGSVGAAMAVSFIIWAIMIGSGIFRLKLSICLFTLYCHIHRRKSTYNDWWMESWWKHFLFQLRMDCLLNFYFQLTRNIWSFKKWILFSVSFNSCYFLREVWLMKKLLVY